MLKNKKGISLIVLIITIIIVIILASVVIMTFSNVNPTKKANEAKFKSDIQGFKEELLVTHSDKAIENPDYNKEDVNVNINFNDFRGMKEYIPDITQEYAKKLFIKNGELLYIGDDTDEDYNKEEEKWAQEQGVESPYGKIGDADGDGRITVSDVVFLSKVIAGVTELPERQKKACDVDCNGQITNADVVVIQKYIAGTINEITCED